jgi:hypothetical protein
MLKNLNVLVSIRSLVLVFQPKGVPQLVKYYPLPKVGSSSP